MAGEFAEVLSEYVEKKLIMLWKLFHNKRNISGIGEFLAQHLLHKKNSFKKKSRHLLLLCIIR